MEFYAAANERVGINGPLKVKRRIDDLFQAVKADYPAIFQANDEVALKPSVLAYIVSQLQMYSLLESDVDVKGHAYEEIVGSNLRGDRGEFLHHAMSATWQWPCSTQARGISFSTPPAERAASLSPP